MVSVQERSIRSGTIFLQEDHANVDQFRQFWVRFRKSDEYSSMNSNMRFYPSDPHHHSGLDTIESINDLLN